MIPTADFAILAYYTTAATMPNARGYETPGTTDIFGSGYEKKDPVYPYNILVRE
jgi:hypothetical protein